MKFDSKHPDQLSFKYLLGYGSKELPLRGLGLGYGSKDCHLEGLEIKITELLGASWDILQALLFDHPILLK
jgi:hypothetical protein